MPLAPASFSQPSPQSVVLTGGWTAVGMGGIEHRLDELIATLGAETLVDGAGVDALDTAGACVLQRLLLRTRGTGAAPTVSGLRAPFS